MQLKELKKALDCTTLSRKQYNSNLCDSNCLSFIYTARWTVPYEHYSSKSFETIIAEKDAIILSLLPQAKITTRCYMTCFSTKNPANPNGPRLFWKSYIFKFNNPK